MINYFIINKLGTVLYQSAQVKKKKANSNTGSINESQRIRYLPLLVIKDLIKANLNNVIQYIKIGNKTVVFKEQQNLLYVACTSKKQHLPINLIQLHLKIVHNFIKFHYGPHWSLHIQGASNSSNRNKSATISLSDIRSCLSQLPFLFANGKLSIRSCDALCSIEQVQVGEDLRFRLSENILSCCDSTFFHQIQQQQAFNFHHHTQQHSPHNNRNSFFNKNNKNHDFFGSSNTTTVTTWAYCYLFAREKIVAQCCNSSEQEQDLLPDEIVYFLKLLVSHYLQEKQETGNTIIRTTTLPQNISISTTTSTTSTTAASTMTNNTTNTTTNKTSSAISPITTSSSSNDSSTTIRTTGSSLAYVYDANSSSAPFKIREKSASSVTVVSSDSYWSQVGASNSKPTLLENSRLPANILIPSKQQQSIADILNTDDTSVNISPFLSSSVPSESTASTTKATALFNAYLNNNNDNISAPSSPTTRRSRSQSVSSKSGNEDSSLKHILSNLISNNESSYLDQLDDVKLVRRWIKLNNQVYLANIIIILLNDGLCSVIICKDDPEKQQQQQQQQHQQHKSAVQQKVAPLWKPTSNQVKQFKTKLKSCLSDFTTFLLTKEATHFTNLSFAVTYPGLVHFIHLDHKGITISPLLMDLNELDKNHELLHEVYGKYYNSDPTAIHNSKWKWPTEPNLKKLCNQILQLGISCRNDPQKEKVLQESTDREYHFLYLRNTHLKQELLAIYFNIVPIDRLWNMHQKLFNDICQRVLLSSTSSTSTISSSSIIST